MGVGYTSNAARVPLKPGPGRAPSRGTPAEIPDNICAFRDCPGGDSLWLQGSRESAVLEGDLCQTSGSPRDEWTDGLMDTRMDI